MGNSNSKWVVDDSDYTMYSHAMLSVPDTLKQFQRIPHMRTGSLALLNKRGISSWFCACTIDAPVACRVALYLLAREDFSGRVHSTYSPSPVLALNYDPGMGQSFPGKFASEIQLSSPHSYIRPTGDQFPVLLRIESLAPAYAAGYTLDSLPPVGSSVTQAMCVHTVFGHLKLTYGAWDMEVLREHLWIAGSPYLLPMPAEVAAYSTLLQHQRLTVRPAQLRERVVQQAEAQELLKVQQAPNLRRMQADAKQRANLAGRQGDYLGATQYPDMAYPPMSQLPQVLPQSMPLQLPVYQPQYATGAQGMAALGTQGLSALSQTTPLQSPMLTTQGMVPQGLGGLSPTIPLQMGVRPTTGAVTPTTLQAPFAGGLPQQAAVAQPGTYPIAQFA